MNLEQQVLNQTEGYEVSSRYNVIPTVDVVSAFERFGFETTNISLANVMREEKQGKQKHLVRMSTGENLFGGEVRPEVLIKNSYDGMHSLEIRVGMFRFVCANGLIVGSNLMPALKILHSNRNWMDVIEEFIDTYQDKYKAQQEWTERMKDTSLHYDEIEIITMKSLMLRHIDPRITTTAIDPMELNIARRVEDRGLDAWHTYNRVQENLMQGYYSIVTDGSQRKAKVLTNTDEVIRTNVELADLFSEYV